jgi:hypothetical protein
MKFIKTSIAALNTKLTPEKQKARIYEKIDYIIKERILLADEIIKEKALGLFTNTEEEDIILTFGGVHLL